MWFRNLFETPNSQRCLTPVPRARRRRPASGRLEALEDRCVPAAVLAIGDVAILEGNIGAQNAAVTVTLSEPHGNNVTVSYRTAAGSATAGSDFDAVSGKLTFTKSEMQKTILVPVRGDRIVEADESFVVQLDSAKGAKIARGQATVTVMDNEPRISIGNAWGVESHSGPTSFDFNVHLSVPYDMPVTVNFATADDSATAGVDYTAATGTLTFAPLETDKTIPVLVHGNRAVESDESFVVNVSSPNSYAVVSNGVGFGTIYDAEPRITIGDVWNYGESTFTFTVSLSAAYDQDVTVDFATEDGTAIAGVDYVAHFGTLTFKPGEPTVQWITIEVLDPTSADKYFSVHLSGASANAQVVNESAYGYWYYDYGYYSGYYDYGYSYDSSYGYWY